MRILIANDDGYLAPGIAALLRACQGLGHIDVIAPEQNASGTSNALTLKDYWRFTPQDVLLHALPIYHTHGLFVAINTLLLAGGPVLTSAQTGRVYARMGAQRQRPSNPTTHSSSTTPLT